MALKNKCFHLDIVRVLSNPRERKILSRVFPFPPSYFWKLLESSMSMSTTTPNQLLEMKEHLSRMWQVVMGAQVGPAHHRKIPLVLIEIINPHDIPVIQSSQAFTSSYANIHKLQDFAF